MTRNCNFPVDNFRSVHTQFWVLFPTKERKKKNKWLRQNLLLVVQTQSSVGQRALDGSKKKTTCKSCLS